MTGTTFQAPLKQGGPDTGVATTNTTVTTTFFKQIDVSAGGKDSSVYLLPDNSFLNSFTGICTVKVSGIAQGAKVLIGDGTTDGLYGTINAVSAVGGYTATITESTVSAKSIQVKVTASVAASAADMADVNIRVNIIGGVRG